MKHIGVAMKKTSRGVFDIDIVILEGNGSVGIENLQQGRTRVATKVGAQLDQLRRATIPELTVAGFFII